MPKVALIGFRDEDGAVPFVEWLDSLPTKAQARCSVRLDRLREMGIELRRPEADYLRDGIYELRIKYLRINYRILYFFHGRTSIVVSHGLAKEKAVPPKEIELAINRKSLFLADPEKHSAKDELS